MTERRSSAARLPNSQQVALTLLRAANRRPWASGLVERAMAPADFFSRDWARDPYSIYRRVSTEGPMVKHRALDAWMLSSYEACEEVLRSPASVERAELFDEVEPWRSMPDTDRTMFTRSLLFIDPPDHTRLRRLVSRSFTPRRVAQLEPRVSEICTRLLDRIDSGDEVDLVAELFAPLPIYVIGELLGVPERDWPALAKVSEVFARFIDPIDAFDLAEMSSAIEDFRDLLGSWVAERRADPGDDLLSGLLEVADDGDTLSAEELEAMVGLLMTAGHETTTGLLGNAVIALRFEPDARERLASEPEVVGPAVEELLRFDSPVQNTDRIAVEDMEICGRSVRAGEAILVMIGAANRDPERFDRPDRLLIDRPDPRSLSFGHGIHHCVGAALARLEASVVLPALYQRHPTVSVEMDRVRWKRSMTLRGPLELPARLS